MSSKMINSGIEWIGEIPEHWEILPNKYIMHKFKDICLNHTDEDIISLTKKGVIIRDLSEGGKMPATFDGYQKVYPGNLLMCLFDIDVTPRCVGVINDKGLTSPAYSQFVLNNNLDVNYYYYYYLMLDEDKTLLHLSKNLRHSLTEDQLGSIDIIKPPLIEQKKIAIFLNRNITIIDQLIEESLILIDRYKEYKQSLVTETVTKSLNTNVEMIDSGIDWIGKIPKHWKINKIKNMCYLKGRIGWHGLTSSEYSDEGAYLVTGTDFKDMHIDWDNCNHISYERYDQDPYIQLKENDLLITKDGTIGKLALIKDIPDKATLNSGIFLVRPLNNTYINDYLYWVLFSDIFVRFFDYIKTGTTISHLYQKTFENFAFPYPDINEQKEIVDYLNKKCILIDKSIQENEILIKKLEEYKKSLIFEYVTGKKEVPNEI